jgi:hypothetical protein
MYTILKSILFVIETTMLCVKVRELESSISRGG